MEAYQLKANERAAKMLVQRGNPDAVQNQRSAANLQHPAITALDVIRVQIAGNTDFRISEASTRRHTSIIVRILTEDKGLEGIGEIVCAPPGKPEELPQEIVGALEHVIAPAIIGQPAGHRLGVEAIVDGCLKGRAWTKAGLSNALYDLQAKLLGVSLTALFGGRHSDEVPIMGTVLGIDSPDRMAERASELVREGYQAVKVKIGETLAADIDRVALVRGAIGPNIQLRVDANDHYKPSEAIRLIRAIEQYDVEHVEQPISRRDILGMVEIRRKVDVPIMTDDMVATPEEAMNVIRLGAADRVKVKVTKHGLGGARLIADMLHAAGMTAVLGHVFETGLAAVAEAHFAASTFNLAGPHEIGSMRPMGSDADVIVENLAGRAGFLRLPDGPGLGVTLDWNRIDALRV